MKRILRKMEKGYDSVSDFYNRTKLPMSMETVRRFISLNRHVTVQHFLIITKYLGFTPNEIRDMLQNDAKKFIVETKYEQIHAAEIAKMIRENDTVFSPTETALISALRKVATVDKYAIESLADHICLMAKGMGVEVAELESIASKRRR